MCCVRNVRIRFLSISGTSRHQAVTGTLEDILKMPSPGYLQVSRPVPWVTHFRARVKIKSDRTILKIAVVRSGLLYSATDCT